MRPTKFANHLKESHFRHVKEVSYIPNTMLDVKTYKEAANLFSK